jgi:hypothetical protein
MPSGLVRRRLSSGRTADTPVLVLGLAALAVGAIVVVALAIAAILYYVL